MRRRAFIALCSAVTAGLAGCSDSSQPVESTSPPTDSTTTSDGEAAATSTHTTRDPQAPSLSAQVDSLQPAVVTRTSADSISVLNHAGKQFLYVDVKITAGEAPKRENLRLRFDGRQHSPSDRTQNLWRTYNDADGQYGADSGEGWVLFELPDSGDASDVALVDAVGGSESSVVSQPSINFDDQLASPSPPLSLELSVPNSVEPEATPTLSFTVTNEGARDGTFVGALNRSGPSIAKAPVAAITETIPPGEPTTFEITDDLDVESPGDSQMSDGEPDMQYDLHWTGKSRSRQIRVVEQTDGN